MKKISLFLLCLPLAVLPILASAQSTQPLSVTCTGTPGPGTITFSAIPSGGQSPYTYSWQATGSVATSSTSNNNSSQFTFTVNDQNPESGQVTVTDAQHTTATAACSPVVAIIQPIVGSCSVEALPENSVNSQATGRTIRFKALIGGGNGTYTYNWSGTDGLTGTTPDVEQTYITSGLKTGTVTIISGDQSATLNCSANLSTVVPVTDPNATTLGGSCTESDQAPSIQKQTIWQFNQEGNATTSTINWSGDVTGTGQTVVEQYTTPGLKTANVSVSSNGQTLNLSCQALLSNTTDTILAPSGCFIATAAWGTPDQPEVVALRKFRDDKLLTTTLGTDFVNLYYQNSPPVADFIRQSDPLKMLVRILLRPVVYVAEKLDK